MGYGHRRNNPRYHNGARRRKYRERFKAMGLPCAICGRPIDYELPYYTTDDSGRRHTNMLAFVIDEKIPVSKWKLGGFSSPEECAATFSNLQPAHNICNLMKSNKLGFKYPKGGAPADRQQELPKVNKLDGKW